MIKMAQVDGITMAAVFCDICKKQIKELGLGTAVYCCLDAPTETAEVLHAHKGKCLDAAEEKLGGRKDTAWQELSSHITDMLLTTGVPRAKIIGLDLNGVIA